MTIRIRWLLLLAALPLPARGDVILQYFESDWRTIERRMPDIFAAGYSAMWLPPPGRGDTGGLSVGYDVFDSFDLGTPESPTLYGTRGRLESLIGQAHRADLNVYTDLILNHRGFRDHTTPNFEQSGGYPAFATFLPGDSYGDFHPPGETDRYTMRISGLIDIAQEKNHQYIRHPASAGANNLPFKPIRPENRALYPDRDLTPNSLGVYPFNTADPLAGDPVAENATGVLLRNSQWMLDVIGVDGFRIDAAKHMPEWFFNSFWDGTVFLRGRSRLTGAPQTPFSFCEVYDGNQQLVAGYIRKDGFGNRDALDFPQYFAMYDVLNANGFGNWSNMVNTTIDGSDGSVSDGSRGVLFAQSHDQFPPSDGNLAHAYILTRPGLPIVYFNAGQFGPRAFPKDGRGDALGDYGSLITTLVDIHNEYGRDQYIQRAIDGDVLVFERREMMIVGLNDNQSTAGARYDERNVLTAFPAGTRLRELTGNAADPAIDPNGDIAEVLVVGGDQRVAIRVPRNVDRRGYVIYGPANPDGVLSITPTDGAIPPDDASVPVKLRRHASVPIVTADQFLVELNTSDADPLDPDDDDNALFRIDAGGDFNGSGEIDHTSGVAAGYEDFLTVHSPRYGGGSGVYAQGVDATQLAEGYHYLSAIAFRHRFSGQAIFETFPLTIYVDRAPPAVALLSPTRTGTNDVTRRQHTVVVRSEDGTATRVHVIVDRNIGDDVMPLVSPANAATRVDAREFRFTWDGIYSGFHTIAVVAFEETGRSSVSRFWGIRANNGFGAGPGDVNYDNAVNNGDIDDFVNVLLSGQYHPGADVNGDGSVDNADIDGFVELLLR